MLIGISSPHKKSGLLWKKFKAHYGREDDDVLVVKGPSIAFNPTIDRSIIDKELAEGPRRRNAQNGSLNFATILRPLSHRKSSPILLSPGVTNCCRFPASPTSARSIRQAGPVGIVSPRR